MERKRANVLLLIYQVVVGVKKYRTAVLKKNSNRINYSFMFIYTNMSFSSYSESERIWYTVATRADSFFI